MLTSLSLLRFDSALGTVEIRGADDGIHAVRFTDQRCDRDDGNDVPAALRACRLQLQEYFAGDRTGFHDVPLVLHATDFQQSVWEFMLSVPYGKTISYGNVAEAIGSPSAARAVGNALADNPLMILVPCHRVVPASGVPGHYAGGAARKEWLLRLENAGHFRSEGVKSKST